MYFEASLRGLKQEGGWAGRDPRPICKQNARVLGIALKLACTAENSGGVGRRSPPLCKHNTRIMGFKRTICFKATLHGLRTRGRWGG